jgi:type IV secretory pathway TrbF-like protein
MGEVSQSPSPQEVAAAITLMDFPQAIREVINGKKITRDAWKNPLIYGFLNGDILSLHKEDDKNYQWIVNDGDLLAEDWFVIVPATPLNIEKEQNELG